MQKLKVCVLNVWTCSQGRAQTDLVSAVPVEGELGV